MKVPTHTVIIGGMTFNMVHTEDHQEALQAETTRRLEAEALLDRANDDFVTGHEGTHGLPGCEICEWAYALDAYRIKYQK